jgi:hypothetical protein
MLCCEVRVTLKAGYDQSLILRTVQQRREVQSGSSGTSERFLLSKKPKCDVFCNMNKIRCEITAVRLKVEQDQLFGRGL